MVAYELLRIFYSLRYDLRMKRLVDILTITFTFTVSLLFLSQSAYADCDIQTCGGGSNTVGSNATSTTNNHKELIIGALLGAAITLVIVAAIGALTKIRKRNTKH
jgi:hypothetical protein